MNFHVPSEDWDFAIPIEESPTRCAAATAKFYVKNLPYQSQCSRRRGYGPDGAYCGQHAKKFCPIEYDKSFYKRSRKFVRTVLVDVYRQNPTEQQILEVARRVCDAIGYSKIVVNAWQPTGHEVGDLFRRLGADEAVEIEMIRDVDDDD